MTLEGGILSWCKPYGRENDWYENSEQFLNIQSILETNAL